MKKKFTILVLTLAILLLGLSFSKLKVEGDNDFRTDNHNDLRTDFNSVSESIYLPYSTLRSNFNSYISGGKVNKTISFNSAEDLYNWSRDLAYNSSLSSDIKKALAKSDYTLGLDIDYSQMKSQRFVPIGYDTNDQLLKFSGTFDGRGFEISNLDFVNYGEYNFSIENQVYVYSNYFSMFNYNLGTIKNFGLIDPVIYLSNENATLRDFAYLVGENSGTVESVYVIDNRSYGNAGMQISSIKVEEATRKRAAGILHTNKSEGTFKNSYFSGISVVHGDFMAAVLEEPIYYFDESNQGIKESVVYNSDKYGEGVPLEYYQEPTNLNSNTESELINKPNKLDDNWFYYKDDNEGLPRLFGLTTDNTKYLITSAVDFIVFNKLLGYRTEALNNKGYNEQTYYLANDINMADVSNAAYRLTENDFSGTFTADPIIQPQINNLTISNGINIDDGYHVGLFYLLSGTFENIRLYNFTIDPNVGDDYVGQTFYVGSIAAKLHEGKISNVTLDINFNFDNSKVLLGAYVIGGLAGEASGTIERIYISGTSKIKINTLTYISDNKISNSSYLGGVVGKTSSYKLSLYNILNEGSIENLNANQLYLNTSISYHIGGIVGYANNTNLVKHDFGLLTNKGSITYHSLTANHSITTYLGGIIGLSGGMMYDFSPIYGKFTNSGEFIFENNKNNYLYVAGVLNSNHESAVEYVQISNDNNLTISHANIYASALINHLSNTKLTVSQANSYGNITYNTVNNKNIAGAIYTSSNSELQLNFINVETNILVNYRNNSSELSVAGLTLNQNANYLNVIYGGTIQVEITNNNTSLVWVAGITKVLSANKLMKNALNEGTIYVYVKTTDTDNSIVKNLYVGGLVNINEAGDLHSSSQSQSMPKASQGIVNSINRALITSYFKNYQGIEGRINTFAGGITSINKGSIQDVVNTGDIRFSNYTNGTASEFVTIDESDVYQGGKTIMYKTGVVIGGIASVVTSGYSRIYDSINSGNILAQSYYYTRSGGILGVVSPFDVSAGSVYDYTESHNVALDTHLKHSVISNGINYGDIYAISTVIGTYTNNSAGSNSERLYLNISANDTWPSNTTSSPAVNMSTRSSSTDRIAIYSAAGGIIGSGLSVLKRMINHGLIGATDAAGGIIGSIFVFTDRNWNMAGRTTSADNAAGVTIVNINTAINYGDIKAVKNTTTIMQAIYNLIDGDISVISGVFYDFDDAFITPLNSKLTNKLQDSVRLYPEYKRGFGGVIGRIQRGGNQNMVTKYIGFTTRAGGVNLTDEEGSFDFIINMNPEVDLIGRLDQNYNFSLSSTAFRFYDAVYYSAKENDNTQAVFTGFYYTETKRVRNSNNYSYFIPNVTISDFAVTSNNYTITTALAPSVYVNPNYLDTFHQVGQRSTLVSRELTYSSTTTTRSFSRSNFTLNELYGGVLILRSGSEGSVSRSFVGVKQTPYISETASSNSQEYVYHEDFVMRNEDTKLTTGESITSFIYYAIKDLLADRLQENHENGMYVLSTTAGSTFGSVLPRNVDVNNLQKISNQAVNNLNYEQLSDQYLTSDQRYKDLLEVYVKDLYQTQLNEKSELLEDDQLVTIKDSLIGTLYYDGFTETDYANKTLTFVVNSKLIGTNREFDFSILEVLLPSNALIARVQGENENNSDLQPLLKAFIDNNPGLKVAIPFEDDNGTLIDLSPDLSLTLPSNYTYNQAYKIGEFTSYSEAAVNDNAFISLFSTTYQVYLKVENGTTQADPILSQISIDGNGFENIPTNIVFSNNLNLSFLDSGNILAAGYIIDEYIKIYYVDSNDVLHEIEKEYYHINSIPKESGKTTFTSLIEFSELLRNGKYQINYKIYQNQSEQTLSVNYNLTRNHQIYDFRPITSTYFDVNETDFAFGYEFDFEFIDNLPYEVSFDTYTYSQIPYLARYLYDIPFLDKFSASSFFEIDKIKIKDITATQDYKEYEVEFTLADGAIVTTIMKETELAPNYYKNNIKIASKVDDTLKPTVAENFVTREADKTTFGLVYNMANSYYDASKFSITYKYKNGNAVNVTTDSIGMSYNVNNRLNIVFDASLEPGQYLVEVKYNRDGIILDAGNLLIEKRLGTSAYLKNIKFSEFVPGIEYPFVGAVDQNNVIVIEDDKPKYNLGIYSLGIDYNNSDTKNHKYYRINGEVSGTPLDYYMPIQLVEYLPIGAKIQRKYYENGVAKWSDLVDLYSTEAEIVASLSANFTVNQETGSLEFDNEGNAILPYVEYRIVSEVDIANNNHNNGVTYFISVRDIKYSFLAVLTYMYYDGTNYHFIDDVAKFNQTVLKIKINNYKVKFEGVELEADEIATDINEMPKFDEIVDFESRMSQFYYVNSQTKDSYLYSLGNNFSGFYHFYLDIDKEYYIYEGEVNQDNLLKEMSTNIADLEGYYYYINYSPITRTRYFTIVITDNDLTHDSWGFTNNPV